MIEGNDRNQSPGYWTGFYVIILFFVVYALLLIYRTSFTLDGVRYFSLADDPMIAMNYAKNLIAGHGLSWNLGERVEGYSNPLWMLYMAFFHIFGIPASKIALGIQLSGLIILIINLHLVRKIASQVSRGSRVVIFIAASLTAFYFSINYWTLHGFEAGLVTLLINWAVWQLLKAEVRHSFSWSPYFILGAGTLVRMDLAVPLMAIMFYSAWVDKPNRIRHVLWGVGILAAFFTSQTIFRLAYLGDIMPNTYYLKMTGYPLLLRFTRGILVFLLFFLKSNALILSLPLFLLFRPDRNRPVIFYWLAAGQTLYSIYVGGDSWEWLGICNRFIVIIMPLYFILIGLAFYRFRLWLRQKIAVYRRAFDYLIPAGFLAVALFLVNPIIGAQDVSSWLLLKPPMQILEHRNELEFGRIVGQMTNPGARIAVVWAGTVPYFIEDRYYIDLLGRCDKKIARERMRTFDEVPDLGRDNNFLHSRFTFFYPGHMKYDYAYSIGVLKPDIVMSVWGKLGDENESMPYLRADYLALIIDNHPLAVRKNSDKVNWALLYSWMKADNKSR